MSCSSIPPYMSQLFHTCAGDLAVLQLQLLFLKIRAPTGRHLAVKGEARQEVLGGVKRKGIRRRGIEVKRRRNKVVE